ncbi:hypothetical protein M5689_019932 [Euphorbia peplus]|nr:hypothetical protein M5689_019932 [Euphorbia peplus]
MRDRLVRRLHRLLNRIVGGDKGGLKAEVVVEANKLAKMYGEEATVDGWLKLIPLVWSAIGVWGAEHYVMHG